MKKIDPICGMKGTIKAHNHYFCSKDCIVKYEKKHNITPPITRRPWFKATLYIVIVLLLIGLIRVLSSSGYMVLFMGVFFVLVSFLKFIDWKGFVRAFAMYDLIAMRSKAYAFVYPFIELAIGIAFLLRWQIPVAAGATLFIMSVGTVGVAKNLLKKNPVKCACLGTKIKIPLTKFTLFEDITMAVMAIMILFF